MKNLQLKTDEFGVEKSRADKKAELEKSSRLAPDKDKLLNLASVIQGIELPIVKNKEAGLILTQVRERLEKTYHDLVDQAGKL